MTSHHATRDALVAQALLTGGRYVYTYAVFRWVELFVEPLEDASIRTAVELLAELSERLGLDTETCRRSLALLRKLKVIAVVKVGPKIRVTVPTTLTPSSVRTLKKLRDGKVMLDFEHTRVVRAGSVLTVGARECVSPAPGGAASAAELTTQSVVKGGFRGSSEAAAKLDQPALGSTNTELQKNELLPQESTHNRALEEDKDVWSTWSPELQANVTSLIERWKVQFGYPTAKHTLRRRQKCRARLVDGYSLAELERCLDVVLKDPFWRGHNDRRRRYDQIERIFHSEERVDGFLATALGTGPVDRLRTDLAVDPDKDDTELL